MSGLQGSFFRLHFRTRYHAHPAAGRLDQHQGCLAPAVGATHFSVCFRGHHDTAIEPDGRFLRSVNTSALTPVLVFIHIHLLALRKEACGFF